jgi:hypothetical protein
VSKEKVAIVVQAVFAPNRLADKCLAEAYEKLLPEKELAYKGTPSATTETRTTRVSPRERVRA